MRSTRKLCACVPAKITQTCELKIRRMNDTSSDVCGCRGVRTCLLCEGDEGKAVSRSEDQGPSLYQCHVCGKIRWFSDSREDHASFPLRVCSTRSSCAETAILETSLTELCRETTSSITAPFDGLIVVKEFISVDEEADILSNVDSHTWVESQSGRRKQVKNTSSLLSNHLST